MSDDIFKILAITYLHTILIEVLHENHHLSDHDYEEIQSKNMESIEILTENLT